MKLLLACYAFFYHLQILNTHAHNGQYSSQIFQATGQKENFFDFRTFGYWVWISPPRNRRAKFKHNISKGMFLDFILYTTCNILWYNCDTGYISLVSHVYFDKEMKDLPYNIIPPNQHDLERVKWGDVFPVELTEVDTDEVFKFFVYPFVNVKEKDLKVHPMCTICNFYPKLNIIRCIDVLCIWR